MVAGCSWLVDSAGLSAERDGGTSAANEDASRPDGSQLPDAPTTDAPAKDARALDDPSSDAPDACTADLASDPKNCGTCGHDCLGGDCRGSLCQPVVVTSSEKNLEELRVAGNRLVYRADLQVRAVDVAGGLPERIMACANRTGLALTDAGFYSWCNASVTLRDIADAGLRATAPIDGYNGVSSGGWFFYRANNQNLARIPALLGDAGSSDVTNEASGFRSLAANSTNLFYMTGAGSLFYAPLASGSGSALEMNEAAPGGIAADDTAVIWLANTDTANALLRMRLLSAGASTVLANGLDHPYAAAMDATYVYVTSQGTPPAYTNGAIVRVPRGGGTPAVLAHDLLQPHEIVVTDRFVIWTSRGTPVDGGYVGGAILRLAK